MNASDYLSKIGLKARDRISGFEGVISTIGFDLYGCVQAVLSPEVDKDGELKDNHWFDFKRLEILGKEPALEQPSFVKSASFAPASVVGPEDKPEISNDPARR